MSKTKRPPALARTALDFASDPSLHLILAAMAVGALWAYLEYLIQ